MRCYCLAGRATGQLDDFHFAEVWRSARRRSRLKTFFRYGLIYRSLTPFRYTETMSERRERPRDRVLRIATIKFEGGEISCLVRNISTTGAALDVSSSTNVPEFFTLFTDGSHRSCQTIWRRQKRIGVAFQ